MDTPHLLVDRDDQTDRGLSNFLPRVHLRMAAGLGLAALTAALIAEAHPLQRLVFTITPDLELGLSPWGTMATLAPFVLLAGASFAIRGPGPGVGPLSWAFSLLLGAGANLLAIDLASVSIVPGLLATALAFVGLGVWGTWSRRDLSATGASIAAGILGLELLIPFGLLMDDFATALPYNLGVVLAHAALLAKATPSLRRLRDSADAPSDVAAARDYAALSLYLGYFNLYDLIRFLLGQPQRS